LLRAEVGTRVGGPIRASRPCSPATTPYLGFADALDAFSGATAVVSVARVARLRKGQSIKLKAKNDPPSNSDYDLATCNGLSGDLSTCQASLDVIAEYIRVQRLS